MHAPEASDARGPALPVSTLPLVEPPCPACGAVERRPEALGRDFEHDTVPDEFRFVRCVACDHVYLCPRPSVEALPRIYPANYYAYSNAGSGFARWLRRKREARKVGLFRAAIGEGQRRILDLGCGNGRLLAQLREHGPAAWELVGVDFSEDAVAQCRERGFRAYATRIEDFTAEDGTFDAVIMIQLIEHLEDPRSTLARVHALLKPGGAFILETPNVAGLDYRWFRGRWWAMYHFPRHWSVFSTDVLTRLLERAGFRVERTDSLISSSSWIVSVHNYLLDRGYPRWLVDRFHFQNVLLLPPVALIDLVRIGLGLPTSDQRVIARRSS
jgi:SAM-dependent methyltransferase